MSDRVITLAEVINKAVESGKRTVFTCIPAKVVKWDAGKQRADCQILIKNSYEDEEGKRQAESWPVVPGVPVQFMGAGGFRLTFPIGDGSGGTEQTIGTLFFSFLSMDKWLSGSGREVDPEFDHDHALADAVFMPGLKPFGGPWGDVPTDAMTLGKDSGLQIKMTDSLVTIAQTAANADFVALAGAINNAFSTIITAHDTHKHATAAVGAPSVPDVLITSLPDPSASKVKAE